MAVNLGSVALDAVLDELGGGGGHERPHEAGPKQASGGANPRMVETVDNLENASTERSRNEDARSGG